MDFPVCPSCGQSVIDDDAEDCPFCGSSMKAKPGAKPAPKAAASATKSAGGTSKPASATAKTGPAAKPAKPAPGDDFPFDTEIPGAKTAIQAMPNQSKGRTLQVVCPMCETIGFVPPTAVGKEVKCANAKCMVPIFKAPAATVEPPPPPPAKKSNLMLVGGATVIVMAVIGGAAVYFSGQSSGPKAPVGGGGLSDEAKAALAEMAATNQSAASNPGLNDTGSKPLPTQLPDENTKKTTANPTSPDEFIAAALKQLNDSCLTGEPRQRSKPYCRQLAADACFRAGDTKAANDHLAQLVIVGSTVPYYRIEPSLEMLWAAWTAGDKTTATRIADGALADTQRLPKVGRNQMEVASRLAAALAVLGRGKEGIDLLEAHQSSQLEGQLSARVQIATDGRLTRLTRTHSVLPWNRPQAVATTASLVARNQASAGRAWAEMQPGDDAKVECLAEWAESVAAQSKPGVDSTPDIADAVKSLSPVLAARVWARAACGRFSAGNQTSAAAALKTAQDLIASVATPQEPVMPEIKPAVSFKLPAQKPLVQAATAAAEISFAHSLWPDHRPQAEEALELALTFVRGLAPAMPAVAARLDQAEQAGASGLREIMKKEFGLKKDDLADQNVKTYRKVLTDLEHASQRRLDLQQTIMSRLIDAGLKSKVWSVVSNRSAETDASKRDDLLNTRLVGELLEAFHGTETEKEIQGAIGGSGNAATERPALGIVRELLKQQNVVQAAQYVSTLDANTGYRDDVALTVATSLATGEQGDVALAFISKLDDIVLREEAYRLAAALLAQRGRSEAVWNQVQNVAQATEKASLCRGLVVGLKAGAPQKDLPEIAIAK